MANFTSVLTTEHCLSYFSPFSSKWDIRSPATVLNIMSLIRKIMHIFCPINLINKLFYGILKPEN